MDVTETIAAVATAPGPGGVGIIRISGPLALTAGLALFTPAKPLGGPPEPGRLYFGDISTSPQRKDSLIDKGYFVFMKGPNSFTGEDITELHCHGGPLLLGKILEGLLRLDKDGNPLLRLAEAGEFTKRAFLNGKIDLTEAEAVAEVIGATSDAALAMASSRLQGKLAREIGEIKEGLLGVVTLIEAELDFSEEEIDGLSDDALLADIRKAGQRIEELISGYAEASAQLRGVRVVITGRPNTGKSSLLNRLLKEERAIVTPLAGTTRDVIEESVTIKGLPARLMDTAGLRHGEEGVVDEVEAIGIERARQRVAQARVVFFVIDGSATDNSSDIELLRGLSDGEFKGNKSLGLNGETLKQNFIIVANKSDKAGAEYSKVFTEELGLEVVAVSALSGAGIGELEDVFFKAVTGYAYSDKTAPKGEAFITTQREKDALVRALKKIEDSTDGVAAKVARECLALELRGALDALGEVIGETTSEDILGRIFSSFCIGK